jgi:hypothetical protein
MEIVSSVRHVFLNDYVKDAHVYELDRASGEYKRIAGKRACISGVGAELNNGLWTARKVFAAILADDRSLWLRIGPDEFDLLDSAIRVVKRRPFPFVRVVEVRRETHLLSRLTFWANVRLELSEWPVYGDFIDWVRSLAKSRDELLQAFLRWNATAAGKNVLDDGTQRELEEGFTRLKDR